MSNLNNETNQNVTQLFSLHEKSILKIDAIYQMIPLFLNITNKTIQDINVLNSRVQHYKGKPIQTNELQNKMNQSLQKWCDKIRKLGGYPINAYKIKFITDEGTRFWIYPEAKLRTELIEDPRKQ
jgi:hypothetical protein